ncbi:MAG: hypothetical protein IJ909_06725 [Fibrobacter sp.]|nr:hypothetical protein [Fibrobacter sp.]
MTTRQFLFSLFFVTTASLVACGDDSSSNSGTTPESSSAASSSSATAIVSSESNASPESSDTTPESSSVAPSSSDAATTSSESKASSKTSSSSKSSSSTAKADTVWNKAYLTWYISWPDPGSEECIVYNGCEWAGYFAGIDGQQTEQWVSEHNIISIHEKDWSKYRGKTFRLRQNDNTIDAVVYDKCADSDCDGCCTQNAGNLGFLIDVESYTCERLTGSKEGCDGVVEWVCLDCE